jgi:hypothetical protein
MNSGISKIDAASTPMTTDHLSGISDLDRPPFAPCLPEALPARQSIERTVDLNGWFLICPAPMSPIVSIVKRPADAFHITITAAPSM